MKKIEKRLQSTQIKFSNWISCATKSCLSPSPPPLPFLPAPLEKKISPQVTFFNLSSSLRTKEPHSMFTEELLLFPNRYTQKTFWYCCCWRVLWKEFWKLFSLTGKWIAWVRGLPVNRLWFSELSGLYFWTGL